jgi:cell wall-associated NlpC family hydrolase
VLAARRRLVPASVVVSAALAVGLLGASGAAAANADAVTTTPTGSTSITTSDVAPVTDTTSTSAVLAMATTSTATTLATTSTTTTATTLTYAQKMAIKRTKAVQVAKWQLPDIYVAGATGPDRFDCSGLTRYVVRKAFGKTLSHYSKAQWSETKRVYRSNIKPGDLVFFFKNGAHHVGMYIGNGKMVHAANPRRDVAVDYVWRGWYGDHYSGAGRIV